MSAPSAAELGQIGDEQCEAHAIEPEGRLDHESAVKTEGQIDCARDEHDETISAMPCAYPPASNILSHASERNCRPPPRVNPSSSAAAASVSSTPSRVLAAV